MSKKRLEPILLKEPDKKRKNITNQDAMKLKDDAMDEKCVVLDLVATDIYIYAQNDAVPLERRQAEILGYLIDQQRKSCSRQKIEEAIWHDQLVSSSAVKRYISALRKILSQALGRDDIAKNVLVTIGNGYEWRAEIPSYVLR